jgi:hypothetical protein
MPASVFSTRKPLIVSGSDRSSTRNPLYEIVKVGAVMRLPMAFGAEKDKVVECVLAAFGAVHNVMGLDAMCACAKCAFATVGGACLGT